MQKYSNIPIEATHCRSVGLVKGGHYFLKSKDADIFIGAAENGKQGDRAPGHSDIFSFELFYKNSLFIIDPGTNSFNKDPEVYNRLRSIRRHNSVYIDDLQIDLAHPKLLEWKSNNDEDILSVQHYAYIKLPDPVICKRTFHLNKETNLFRIKDELIGGIEHHANANLHFHPSIILRKIDDNHYSANTDVKAIEIKFHSPSDYFNTSIREVEYSPRYGKLGKTNKISIHIKDKFPSFFITEIILL